MFTTLTVGPFRADHIRDGERFELSNGHLIYCPPSGARRARARTLGGSVLRSDPAVTAAGTDTGVAFNDGKNLRAPDLVVNVDLNGDGWVREAPPLAVEYASVGQDKDELARKVAELLEFGTRTIWVVHLVGPLRVEVHERGVPVRIVPGDGTLTAPGILQNPVPVRALVDRAAAHEATLRNLLARQGYASLDAIRDEARDEGRYEGRDEGRNQQLARVREALHDHLRARGWTPSPSDAARIAACADVTVLVRWIAASVTATSVEAALR